MLDWNVVVTAQPRSFNRAIHALAHYADVSKTGLYNVLVLSVPDVYRFLDDVRERAGDDRLFDAVSHIFPVTRTFSFGDRAQFEDSARAIATEWAPGLAGKSFHVRMHRRGLEGQLHSMEEEQALGVLVLEALQRAGTPGRVAWDDPDAILSIETVRDRAGMALWTRADFQRYPFLLASIEPRAATASVTA